ncbi:ATP-binding protein [Streptomyces sp. NPDC085659]|uniref:ATP-binding protein n=1 Tax=Streptomyces sp. NPDC085659 TaxID=3155177 RepID=UPI00344C5BFA
MTVPTRHAGEPGQRWTSAGQSPYARARSPYAELAANAATHRRVQGRDFQLHVAVREGTVLRIAVTNTKGDRLPLADRWGVASGPVPRKTVWAELDLVP